MGQFNSITPMQAQNHWMNQLVKGFSDEYLAKLVEEVDLFHRTGVLSEKSGLRDLRDQFSSKALDKISLQTAEDQVLMEAARRFHNSLLNKT